MTELSRIVSVDRLPATFDVAATAAECAALATRYRILGVLALHCRFQLRRQGDVVTADGVLAAQVEQSCVVSLDPVQQPVHERFVLRFVPAGTEGSDEDPDSPDELPYDRARIDLGEAAAEQLALALDPYPRHPDATLDATDTDIAAGPGHA